MKILKQIVIGTVGGVVLSMVIVAIGVTGLWWAGELLRWILGGN